VFDTHSSAELSGCGSFNMLFDRSPSLEPIDQLWCEVVNKRWPKSDGMVARVTS